MDLAVTLNSLTYLLEYILYYLMLPGQIENWNLLIDLNFMGLSKLPLKVILALNYQNYKHIYQNLYK